MNSLSNKPVSVSIVGSGHTPFGRLDAISLETLIVEATRGALADAAIDAKDIDAVYLGHFNSGMVPDGFASSLIFQADNAFRFKPATRCENACASGAAAIYAGIRAIQAGAAKNVLVVGVEKMTSNTTAEVTKALGGAGYQHDAAEAGLSFPQVFGLAAQAYAEAYGDPSVAMAKIAEKNHKNALLNPLAQMRRDVSFDFCNEVSEKNPLIAPPYMRLTDCSLISDGAAAIVLTADDNASAFKRSVRFRAAEHVSDFLPMSRHDIVKFEGPRLAISRALAAAKLTINDINFAEVHDCFTIAELLCYEALGLTPAGRGIEALNDGTVYRGGKLPVNLSGGLKAKGHPVGATGVSMHALAYRQLTGNAGEMQLDNASLGLVFNMGGSAVANYVSVLETVR